MVLSFALGIEREFSFGDFPHQQLIAGLQFVQARSESSCGHQFEEEFDFIFKRRGDDRVRTLGPSAVVLYPERRVLPGSKLELAAGLNANHPKVGRELLAGGDPCQVKLIVRHHSQQSSERLEASEYRLKDPSQVIKVLR